MFSHQWQLHSHTLLAIVAKLSKPNMKETENNTTLEPKPALQEVKAPSRGIHIGLLSNYSDTDETRFLLTP